MTPEQIVRAFFEEVRSGRNLDYADTLMAEQVLAHQVVSEEEVTVNRTPSEYADHVREMIQAYGEISLEIQELIAQGDKVYVRWRQEGIHIGEVDGYAPTHRPVIEIASAVYRVENERIAEYWIQIDRLGIEKQLERNKS
ncbi:ester cyclase [Paenibacillus pabuli]|uniref:ester cyclase n=1 Tax=Paenibacillus TaxID=44249 RepID=UPI000BA6AD98|nr:ester cyclase [Paenibacillus sp. 7523-1]MBM6386832.1 ester cyclase [Paenibacillus sp.]PAD29506.1 polyketide cyclase [Paenibacillus sp. 7523-1]